MREQVFTTFEYTIVHELKEMGGERVEESDATPNLKIRLVDTATQLLTEHGSFKLPTMRKIASATGVTPGAAYRHFASQEDLFISVISGLFEQLEQTLTEAAQESRGLRAKARNIAQSYVAWGLRNPGGYQLLFETTDNEEILKAGARPGLGLLEQFARALPGNGDLNSKQTQRITRLWVSLHGLVSLRIHKTGMPWSTSVEHDVDELVKLTLKP